MNNNNQKFSHRGIGFRFVGLCVVAILLNACASKAEIRTTALPNADFSQYKSFYMLPAPPGRPGQRISDTFNRMLVIAAVRKELLSREFIELEAKENSDFLVAVQFSMKNETRVRNVVNYDYQPTSFGYGYGYGYGYRSYYGYSLQPSRSVEIEEIRQGNMLIDMIDSGTQSLVWEGFAQGKGERSLSLAERKIHETVVSIFKQFPG